MKNYHVFKVRIIFDGGQEISYYVTTCAGNRQAAKDQVGMLVDPPKTAVRIFVDEDGQ